MAKKDVHKWQFRASFRRNSFGWRSQPAIKRVKEAVAEIKKVAKKDKLLATEGAVIFLEKVSPALTHVDSSSGAVGATVNNAVEALVPIISSAPADEKMRMEWLERLFLAHSEDQVPYIEVLSSYWGELCVSQEIASYWADELLSTTRSVLNPEEGMGGFFHGSTICLSALYASGRHEELIDLLKEERFWHYKIWSVKSMVALQNHDEAINQAEMFRKSSSNEQEIDALCEEILLAQGKVEEAYLQYGLWVAKGGTYLARFRAVAKKYPHKEGAQILADLVDISPGNEGKWFAAAKSANLFDEAIALANRAPTSPQTLTRAARDFQEKNPQFALEAGMAALKWLAQGFGYEITSYDIIDAYDFTIQAARNAGVEKEALECIRVQVAPDVRSQSLMGMVLKRKPGFG